MKLKISRPLSRIATQVRRTFALTTLCMLLCGITIGCGEAEEETAETAPVTGIVTYKGEPVESAVVTFIPQGQGSNRGTDKTEANGRFSLTTFHARDGAIPGVHAVTVQLMPEGGLPGQEVESTGATPIPKVYEDPKKTPLSLEVKAGETNDFTIELVDQ